MIDHSYDLVCASLPKSSRSNPRGMNDLAKLDCANLKAQGGPSYVKEGIGRVG